MSVEAPPAETTAAARVEERSERRYIALVGLAKRLPSAHAWDDFACVVSQALADCNPAAIRLWAMTSDGLRRVASAEIDEDQEPAPEALELKRAASLAETTEMADGGTLVGLHGDGVTLGVLEVRGEADRELINAAAPLIACRLEVLAGQTPGTDVRLLPAVIGDVGDAAGVIADFARQAKRLLDHDRLSVYLLSHDGQAFERFAVATSTITPGEGVLIPFEDVGLRHTVLTNRPIVSSDLGADPRLAGAEDRVIARAGFRGLLSVPLRHQGRPFGVLNFVSRRAGFYRNEDVPLAEQIADQIAVFIENLRLQRSVQASVRQQASERERTRLVRDLYQAAAQALSEISDAAEALGGPAKPKSGTRGKDGGAIRRTAERGLAEMRRAIIDLDPPGLESGGLTEMVEHAVERFGEQSGCEASVQIEGDGAAVPAPAATATYRVMQEALMNVRLHAGADRVEVRLEIDRDLLLVVEDDGSGFDVRAASQAEGMGLRHMRERTEALGGFLTIRSERGSGTTVRLKFAQVAESASGTASRETLDGEHSDGGALRVLVAHGELLLRAGLCRLVDGDDGLRIVGQATTPEEVKARLRQLHPDVILASTGLATDSAEALVGDIRRASRSTAILAISHGDATRDAELIEAGATGVIHLPIDEESLTQSVRAVACGTRVVGGSRGVASDAPAAQALTARERSILTLVAGGQTNAQIGSTLYLATKTVERQVATIVRKLNARNRAHASAIAVARQIVELPR